MECEVREEECEVGEEECGTGEVDCEVVEVDCEAEVVECEFAEVDCSPGCGWGCTGFCKDSSEELLLGVANDSIPTIDF